MSTPTLVVLISGSGTNLQAIIDAIASKSLNTKIVLVVSNRKAAFGLVRAEQHGISTKYFPLKPYTDAGKTREEYDADLATIIAGYDPTLVVLAGWMQVFTPIFLNHFPNKVINLHPALPGAFAGTHAIEQAFEAFQNREITESGCMIHYVIPEVDAGQVITTAVVPFRERDTLESYEERMHEAEHELIVKGIRLALEGSA
jgi:formyltetrahydrofolate-dependent phosphoribosylglycinamide formyltransferase